MTIGGRRRRRALARRRPTKVASPSSRPSAGTSRIRKRKWAPPSAGRQPLRRLDRLRRKRRAAPTKSLWRVRAWPPPVWPLRSVRHANHRHRRRATDRKRAALSDGRRARRLPVASAAVAIVPSPGLDRANGVRARATTDARRTLRVPGDRRGVRDRAPRPARRVGPRVRTTAATAHPFRRVGRAARALAHVRVFHVRARDLVRDRDLRAAGTAIVTGPFRGRFYLSVLIHYLLNRKLTVHNLSSTYFRLIGILFDRVYSTEPCNASFFSS